jgi:hypothetical protein
VARRPKVSVAAPFVWRCLNGRTVTQFPHRHFSMPPPITSGRSDIDGWDSRPLRNAAFARLAPTPDLQLGRIFEFDSGRLRADACQHGVTNTFIIFADSSPSAVMAAVHLGKA